MNRALRAKERKNDSIKKHYIKIEIKNLNFTVAYF